MCIHIHTIFIVTVKCGLESRSITRIKGKLCYLKTDHPTFPLVLLVLWRAPTFTLRLWVNNCINLGVIPQEQEPSCSPDSRNRVQHSSKRVLGWLLFAWCPQTPVHYPASSLTQRRLGGAEWVQAKGLDQWDLNFNARGSVSKTMPLLLKINCLKRFVALKHKFAALLMCWTIWI